MYSSGIGCSFQTLPHMDRIAGVRVAGKAFADCLMVLEFVHNFSSALGFGKKLECLLYNVLLAFVVK